MAKKQTDKTQEAVQAMTDTMTRMQQMGMDSMGWMGGDWFQKMNDLGSEMMHFMAERWQRDIELQQKLMHCTDLKQLHEVQAEFLQTMIDRYTEESGRLVEMSSKLMEPPSSGK